jgi:hypothetical protein
LEGKNTKALRQQGFGKEMLDSGVWPCQPTTSQNSSQSKKKQLKRLLSSRQDKGISASRIKKKALLESMMGPNFDRELSLLLDREIGGLK